LNPELCNLPGYRSYSACFVPDFEVRQHAEAQADAGCVVCFVHGLCFPVQQADRYLLHRLHFFGFADGDKKRKRCQRLIADNRISKLMEKETVSFK
jgi:hypothetical protein